jgi:membrane associated rhomboid family serine protease
MPEALSPIRRQAAREGVELLIALLVGMWGVQVVNAIDNYRLDRDGIVPRDVGHLYGVLTAPFLHASYGHLIGNTVPFAVLGLAIAAAGAGRLAAVTAIVILVAGLGTWLTASSHSVTVGASGVVFGYAGYLLSRGVFDRKISELLIGVGVGVVFGGALLVSLVPHTGVSWQDHLFGAIGGVISAQVLSAPRPPQAGT